MPTINKPKRKSYQRKYHSDSRKERQKVYQSERWQRLRRSKLLDNPTCELCLEHDVITPAVDVHHIISFMSVADSLERRRLAFDRENLKSLCRECHNFLHNQTDDTDTPWGRKYHI